MRQLVYFAGSVEKGQRPLGMPDGWRILDMRPAYVPSSLGLTQKCVGTWLTIEEDVQPDAVVGGKDGKR